VQQVLVKNSSSDKQSKKRGTSDCKTATNICGFDINIVQLVLCAMAVTALDSFSPLHGYKQWRSQAPDHRGLVLGRAGKNPFPTVAILHYLTLFDTVALLLAWGVHPSWLRNWVQVSRSKKSYQISKAKKIAEYVQCQR
jgi:hypothetical protein